MDIDLFMGEITLNHDSTIAITVYTNLSPRVNITIPKTFHDYFGKTFCKGWLDNLEGMFEKLRKNKKKGVGLKGTPFEAILENMSNNPNLKTYK